MNTVEKETLNMSKSKTKRKDERLKKHLHLNILEESYGFLKESGLNASQLLENVLKRLRMGLGEQFKVNSADLVLISQKRPNAEASGEIRTRGLVLTKDALYH